MLPPPLAPPLPTRPMRGSRRRIPWLALLGFALILAAVVGAIAWGAAFSPYGFVRFAGPSADRTITISRPGDYLIYEEGADASDRDLPPRVAITVNDRRGRSLHVDQLIAPRTRGAPFAYHVPPHEGRAIGRFTATRSGLYRLHVELLDPKTFDRADYRPDL